MIRFFASFILVAFSINGFAYDVKSAKREPGVSYLGYKSMASILGRRDLADAPNGRAASDSAVRYADANALPSVTAWDSVAAMNERFARMRDTRWLQTDDHPGFLRRSSWLYPDDGCFARAGLAIMHFAQWALPVPSKIFVFGDLVVNTANAPGGSVSWWYHVAPIVQVGADKYVLDPALEPKHPLKLEDWLAKMGRDIHRLEVAICAPGSYTPDDRCDHVTDGVEAVAADDQIGYLQSEWLRLEELKRDPTRELGDQPPWLSSMTVF